MTPERLAQIREHIRNPSSASLNRDWMMELVDEVAAHVAPLSTLITPVVPIPAELLPEGLPVVHSATVGVVSAIDHEAKAVTISAPVVIDDRPAPKKKGKK